MIALRGQRVPDLDALAGRLLRRHASLLDLVKVYHLVKMLPRVVATLQVRGGGVPGAHHRFCVHPWTCVVLRPRRLPWQRWGGSVGLLSRCEELHPVVACVCVQVSKCV